MSNARQAGGGDQGQRPLRVLVLSRNYPNDLFPLLGLWVENVVRHSTAFCQPKVIAPVPYCPPLPGLGEYYTRFRRIARHRWDHGIEIFHPRFVVPPAHWLHSFESFSYYLGVVGLTDRLRRDFPFDLIHAHFTFPDGWVAARLGQRYGIPVIITEHAAWRPWMENYWLARRQALWAARQCAFHIAISRALRDSIASFTGESEKLVVIPNAVDGSLFTLAQNGMQPSSKQILFVGVIRPVKGVDILLRAMKLLADRGREVNLVLVGESFYASYRREYERVRQMASELGLEARVEFAGRKLDAELVRHMQESALLVLPSRRESFGAVLTEALACGTPVVATRCGGPEDIVNDEVGVLVPPENPEALAQGIEQVLSNRASYEPGRLRAYSLQNFGVESVGRRLAALYQEVLEGLIPRGPQRRAGE